ncbi:hypothetical protein GHO45_25875, partial [Pseudomonas sp. FSL R10-0765]|nr:hypothetical protein [Pseudomonas sp. FSL R10-0765]
MNTSRRHTFIWALSALVVLAIAWSLYAHWPGMAHKDRPMGMGGSLCAMPGQWAYSDQAMASTTSA